MGFLPRASAPLSKVAWGAVLLIAGVALLNAYVQWRLCKRAMRRILRSIQSESQSCANCKYDLTGHITPVVCPECGTKHAVFVSSLAGL